MSSSAESKNPGDDRGQLEDYEASALQRGELLHPTFDELSAIEGFESGGFREGSDDLEFYWHGALPDAAEASVARAEQRGQRVHLVMTPYSYDEIWKLSIELVDRLIAVDIDVEGFGPNRRHDTIELMGPRISSDPDRQKEALTIADQLLPDDVSVAFVPNEVGITYDVRHSDSGNPTPGGEVRSVAGSCTGGLGMRRSGFGHYLLTAAHCFNFQSGATATIPGSSYVGGSAFVSTLFGVPGSSNSATAAGVLLDAGLVSYGSGNGTVDNQMFVGSNVTGSKQLINGTGTIPWETNLCSTGAATGLRCFFERSSEQVRRCIGGNPCTLWADIVGVGSVNNSIMFGDGDSGGPIYYLSGGSRVVVGIVEGGVGQSAVECGAANVYSPETQCSIVQGRITSMTYIRNELPGDMLVNVG